jgi:hypothetical protein
MRSIVCIAALIGLAGAACGALIQPEKAPPASSRPAAEGVEGFTISSVAFMAGAWRSDDGGITEEHWSAPAGNNVMGMFRWLKPDGTPMIFEILTITQETQGVVLRLKHFSATLVGKEEKADSMTLILSQVTPTKAVFKAAATEKRLAAVTYERPTKNALHVTVEFPDPAREPLKFELARTAASGG